jgi:hypothetical protein
MVERKRSAYRPVSYYRHHHLSNSAYHSITTSINDLGRREGKLTKSEVDRKKQPWIPEETILRTCQFHVAIGVAEKEVVRVSECTWDCK